MADAISKILMSVKADVGQAKAAVRDLRGEEKKAHLARLKELQADNDKIDQTIAKWGKAVAVIGGVVAAYKTLQASTQSYFRNQRAEAAAGFADIERLDRAMGGLVERTEVLEMAARLQAGVWRLNNDEMEKVGKGALALRKKFGVDLKEATDSLTKAFREGASEELKKFGILAKDKKGVLKELDRTIGELGGNTAIAGDHFKRGQKNMADSFDELKTKIGELAVKLSPLLGLMAKFVSHLGEAIDELNRLDTGGAGLMEGDFAKSIELERLRAERKKLRRIQLGLGRGEDEVYVGGELQQGYFGGVRGQGQNLAERISNLDWAISQLEAGSRKELEKVKDRAKKRAAGPSSGNRSKSKAKDPWRGTISNEEIYGSASDIELELDNFQRQLDKAFPKEQARKAIALSEIYGTEADQELEADNFERELNEAMAIADKARLDLANKTSLFAQMFGTSEEVEGWAATMRMAQRAFAGLSDAFGAGIGAMITGSESFSAAFKKAIAQSLLSIATQSAVEALKYTAMGIAAAVTPGLQGQASGYFASAAQFGVTAVAAGAGARLLGVGGGSSKSSSSGVASARAPRVISSGSAGGSAGGNGTTVVNMGGDFLGYTASERAAAMARAIKTARKGSQTIRRQ